MNPQISRRRVVTGIGAAAAMGTLAGCSSAPGDGGDGGGDGSSDGSDGSDGDSGGSDGDVPSAVSDYLSDANGYDGGVTDMTGSDSPTVSVGAGSDGFAFDPAAIRVSTGTTVTWEWTGKGGGHNVVAEDDTFTSGDEFVDEEGHTYEYTFEEAGNYPYYCEPHQSVGMLGAVVVE